MQSVQREAGSVDPVSALAVSLDWSKAMARAWIGWVKGALRWRCSQAVLSSSDDGASVNSMASSRSGGSEVIDLGTMVGCSWRSRVD